MNKTNRYIALWLLVIGLILLLVNSVLDLGVIPICKSPFNWILTIISKMVSAIGMALILGFTTDKIKELIKKYQKHSKGKERELADQIVSLKEELTSFQQNADYIHFVENLFYNQYQTFDLIPRIRIYLHKNNIKNDIHILKLNITCIVNGAQNENEDFLFADSKVIFEYEISQDTVPNTYEFITGNDFTQSPQSIKFSYGNKNEQDVMLTENAIQSESSNPVRHISLKIEKQNVIFNNKTWKMKLEIDHIRVFDFRKIKTDTIICIPKVFGEDIDKINYTIKIVNFETNNKFYCNLHKCFLKDNEYVVTAQDVHTISKDSKTTNEVFNATILPDSGDKEQAYYFKLDMSSDNC